MRAQRGEVSPGYEQVMGTNKHREDYRSFFMLFIEKDSRRTVINSNFKWFSLISFRGRLNMVFTLKIR